MGTDSLISFTDPDSVKAPAAAPVVSVDEELAEEVGDIKDELPSEDPAPKQTVPRIVGREDNKPVVAQVPKDEATNTGGRPIKWKPEYNDLIIGFFDVEAFKEVETVTYGKNEYEKHEPKLLANHFPTLEKFAHSIDVNTDTLVEWAKYDEEDTENNVPDEEHRCIGFSAAYTRAKQLQKSVLIDGGISGVFNGQFAIFVAKNITDMKDRSELDVDPDGTLAAAVARVKKNMPD